MVEDLNNTHITRALRSTSITLSEIFHLRSISVCLTQVRSGFHWEYSHVWRVNWRAVHSQSCDSLGGRKTLGEVPKEEIGNVTVPPQAKKKKEGPVPAL